VEEGRKLLDRLIELFEHHLALFVEMSLFRFIRDIPDRIKEDLDLREGAQLKEFKRD
jgi:predicted unusual protein kinase regulating ubiquinone biosynthesis (AarF/ABC1/UbiB family)